MLKFSENLKKYRQAKELSQETIAQKLYVSRQAVSKWEQGEGAPDLNNLVKLAELLDVSLDTLVLGTDPESAKIDPNEYAFDPTTGLYKRKLGQMNGWDFLARFWWLIFPIFGFVYGLIQMLK
ncbi:helix-turn-helix domain-containing protein [Loigolactobacillus bifermentans]|uniref:Helix-turn-helix XRE-family transcriptional regulator n=1 Tax=Loigolactobacillus bifermentans DSM 20003 TaxID=1423726 RepID=A0A0R1H4Y4_9LACO|nr:helix-turn-helix domain-containing protein [Loigolactobacillus bifermentans]KRK39635.1 helix-turn-helix XRE-family transcriptional regulator [Loigolactobacillus bifermentans DSM 20003]QGG60743.1 helix-turn-helix domain-containing protein [Loigolactobacillus bifermentans]